MLHRTYFVLSAGLFLVGLYLIAHDLVGGSFMRGITSEFGLAFLLLSGLHFLHWIGGATPGMATHLVAWFARIGSLFQGAIFVISADGSYEWTTIALLAGITILGALACLPSALRPMAVPVAASPERPQA